MRKHGPGAIRFSQYRLRSSGSALPVRPLRSQSTGARTSSSRLAHHTRSNLPLVVDHDGCRDHVAETELAHSIEVRAGGVVRSCFGSYHRRWTRRRTGRFSHVRLRKLREAWELVRAWLTPCSPEVEHDDFSVQAGSFCVWSERFLRESFGAVSANAPIEISAQARIRSRRITKSLR